jgi:flavodoxin
MQKVLWLFFSREGKNYVSGAITDLPVGNTEVVARMIQKATGSDSFRIQAMNPYPEDYHQTTDMAQKEQRANARPELTAHVENMDAYDVIFLGYPNWDGSRCRCSHSWRNMISPEKPLSRSAPMRAALWAAAKKTLPESVRRQGL